MCKSGLTRNLLKRSGFAHEKVSNSHHLAESCTKNHSATGFAQARLTMLRSRAKTPKSVNQLLNEEFDYVITLGRRAQSCDRKFPCAEVVHRKFDDPRGPDDPERQLREFRTIRDQILQRLRLFVLVHLRSQIPSRPTSLPMNAASGSEVCRRLGQ